MKVNTSVNLYFVLTAAFFLEELSGRCTRPFPGSQLRAREFFCLSAALESLLAHAKKAARSSLSTLSRIVW